MVGMGRRALPVLEKLVATESYPQPQGLCKNRNCSYVKLVLGVLQRCCYFILQHQSFPYNKNGFKVGMKLEGVDPEHQSVYCVLTVAEVSFALYLLGK